MSFALPPIPQSVVPQTAWDATATIPSALPAIFEAKSRIQKLEQIRKAHRSQVARERVGAIVLPKGFTVQAVAHRLDQLNTGSAGELHDRINEKELELWESQRDRRAKGLDRFKRSLRSLQEKSGLLGKQRANSYITNFVCEIQGDLPSSVPAVMARSFYWEEIGRAILVQELIPQVLGEAQHASSPKLLANVERAFWARWGRVSQFLDRVLTERERLTLLIDCWNSKAPSEVYALKPWRKSPLHATWETHLDQLEQATQMLENVVVAEVPAPRILESFLLPAELGQFSGDLFQAEIGTEEA